MPLRSVPIRRSGVRNNLFMGGDRELVMLAGVAAAGLIGPAIDEPKAWIAGLFIWFGGLWAARLMAKADPLLRGVYLRHRAYRGYYAARSTPFRLNSRSQRKRYSEPGKKK
ncbi:conjugal transfer protein TrbD [Sphingomonas sp. PAMC 26605]|uniref:conjugal transfer protein TrbD n=1 Tax=Sphingomonas sp. PAMC 26605 TaxID=1112214 RepID=UPI00049686A8|nr:conjugal transfer protein TrbD [Sphingomonas sp. PAMC 26605]